MDYHLQSSMLPPPSGPPIGRTEQHRPRPIHEIPSLCTPQILSTLPNLRLSPLNFVESIMITPWEYLTRKPDSQNWARISPRFLGNKTKQNKTKQNKTKQNKTKQNITACKSCTFRGDNIRWNFLHHTAASRCEDFRTFRSLTPSPSTGCAAGLVEPQADPVDGESPKRWLKYDIVSTSARYCCVSSNACHVHLLIFYVYKTIATQNWLNLLHKLLSHSVQAVSVFNKVQK